MKQKPFKVGDRVYAILNSAWGARAMTVKEVHKIGCTCTHSGNLGSGYFSNIELAHVTDARRRKISIWLEAVAAARKLESALFETKYE